MSNDDDDSESEINLPAANMPLLEQIAFVEHRENLKKLGVS